MLLVVGGMIGAGKSSLSKIVAEHFNSIAYYEDINSPILERFYVASEEEKKEKRWGFLLQLHFLNSRFKDIKKCLSEGDNQEYNILDRSIYEDWYFAKVNKNLGNISDIEFGIYEELVENMMSELQELPKKSPDLMIYLKGSFSTFVDRINKRSRDFELDSQTLEYFHLLWSGYDDWVTNHYNHSEILIIDVDKYDYVENAEDAKEVICIIEQKLKSINEGDK